MSQKNIHQICCHKLPKNPKKKKNQTKPNQTKQNNKTETVLQEGDEKAAKLPETYDSERLTAAAQDKKSPDKKSC
jgi:hypothetical protein